MQVSEARGLILFLAWVVLQLIFVFEVAIGATFMSFFVRSIGTTLGCLWGWAAFEARHGDPVVCVALIFVGMIPAVYIQLGSQYPKAGIVATISMSVVALSTALKTVPGMLFETQTPVIIIRLLL